MRASLRAAIVGFGILVGCKQEQVPPSASGASGPSSGNIAQPTAIASGVASAPAEAAWDAEGYKKTIDDALDALLASDPTTATRAGDHRFDDKWPAFDAETQAKTATDFRARAEVLRKVAPSVPANADPAKAGTDHPSVDAQVLADRLEFLAYELDTLRLVERDPSRALGSIGSGLTGLMDHDYAPKQVRLERLAARLERLPDFLKASRARLKKPARSALENTAIVAKGMGGMLRGPAIDAWLQGSDAAFTARVKKSADAGAAAIDAYAAEIAKTFPVAKAVDEPIGAEKWATLARLGEGVTEGPAEIRKLGEAELVRLQTELDELIAKTGKPNAPRPKTPADMRANYFATLEKDQPKLDKVLDDYRAANKGVEEWMHAHPFVTVPWDKAKLEIVQTPPHMRGISFASMNVAGPLEPVVSDARFEVNVPDATMPADKQQALLKFHAHGALEMVSVHEAIPGHYLQFLFVRQVPSKVRKLTGSATLIEGWAHYCELAAREAGYTGGDEDRLHAFYLRMALQRAARVVVDVAENDGSMTVEQGAKFLAENALLAPEAAKIEARRAVVWPSNMFSYTYGKLAIVKLRDEVKAREKEKFDLVKFHDRLLAVGLVPIKYVGPLAFGTK